MANPAEVLVLGGGVIGLSVAYYLAREGVKVQVIDQGNFGQESSWAGAGILPPGNLALARTPFDRLRAWSVQEYPRLSQELRERTGQDNGYLQCGALEFPVPGAETTEDEWRGAGVRAEHVTGRALRELAPGLAPSLDHAWFLPDLAQVRNPRHLKALIAGCAALRVRLSPGLGAKQLVRRGSRIEGVETEQGLISAPHLVLAAGAWTEALLTPLGIRLGIKPVRGQIVLLHDPARRLRHVLLKGSRYLVPRADGHVLIGSTEEDVGFNKQTTAVAVAELLRLGFRLVPYLADAAVERAWAGLRPGSPDGLPFIGRAPGWDNLYVAAGHFRSGIQLAPGTAWLIKELILGQPLTIEAAAFQLERSR